MELNRAGNPLQIYWDFNVKKSDGIVEAFPLEGKPLRLTLITPRGKKEIKDFKAHGNVIEWLFSAQYQTTYGDHSLLLEVLSSTGKVLSASDQCKFIRIVDKSCMSSDNDIVVDGETKTLTLSTEMSVVRIMPVVPEVGENGNWWVDGEDTGKPSTGAIDPALRAEINNKADKSSVPTKTSQLTNDSGFITKDGVPAPDWNASTYKEGHIKNRTHFMFRKENQIQTECIQESSNPAFNKYDEYDNLIELYIPLRDYRDDIPMGYFIKLGDEEVFVKHTYGEEKFTVKIYNYVYTFEPVYDESISEYYCLKVSILDGYYDSSTEIQIADYDYLHPIPLGEFYIPETFARKSEIATINGKSLTKGGNIVIEGKNYDNELAEQSAKLTELSAEVSEVSEDVSYLDLGLKGAVSYSIGSSASGWHYYPVMALRKGTYRFSIELSAAVSATMYWTIVADGTSTTLLPSKAISAGNTVSEVELTLSQDYENCQVGIYSGVAKPSCVFSIIAPTSINGELMQLREVKTILTSSRYFYADGLLSESAAYPRLLKNQHKGRVDGVKISISKGGTLVLAKAIGTNGDNTNPSFVTIQTFNVKVGINYLDFDTPVMLEDNEGIVIYTGSTASFHRAPYSATNDTGSMYFNGKNWMTMPNGDVMAIYANDMSNTMDRLGKVEKRAKPSVVYPSAPPSLYHHLFIFNIDKNSIPTIPCQSVFDVAVAAKLGFKMIEFNVSETADGVAVTGHPVSGTLQTLDDLSGNPVALTIGSMNYSDLRNNYRYRSVYPQFRVPISSLEECLRECQRYDLTPMVQCVSQSVVDLTESIVGKRYVAYGATRKMTDALIYIYHSTGTIDSLLEQCDIVGYPYMLGIAPALLDSWSDEEIKDLLKRAHAKGAWVNWAGCYHTPESNLRMKRLGLDSCASGWEVIDFAEFDERKVGNVVKGFSDFAGTFSANADGANLSTGQQMKVEIGKMGILAKGQLSIQFVGKLTIAFGSTKTNGIYESDGSSIMTINSIIENEADLVITASADSKVYSIDYKTAIVI